jgi:hypothetical protein
MARIAVLALVDFKHGRTAFKAGVNYSVPFLIAGYLIGSGWAAEAPSDTNPADIVIPELIDLQPNAPPPPADPNQQGDVVVQPHDGVIGMEASQA